MVAVSLKKKDFFQAEDGIRDISSCDWSSDVCSSDLPPGHDHPLLNLPEDVAKKLILTSHIAGETTQDLEDMFSNAWENMDRVVSGERPINIVNGL